MAWLLIGIAALALAGLTQMAWTGSLGLLGIPLLITTMVCYTLGRRKLDKAQRKSLDMPAKLAFTIVGMMALLRHPIEIEEGVKAPIYEAIATYITQVDAETFIFWALVAMAVKFVGVITSAYTWHLLLVGQGIRFPFWQKIMTAFLIGRFIGTFLPSTIGLDGYTLYEANRYSNQGARAVTAKALEKFIGVTGLFLTMILTMPFGYSVITNVAVSLDRPEVAPMLAGAILAVAGGISGAVILGLVKPIVLIKITEILFSIYDKLPKLGPLTAIQNKLSAARDNFVRAVGAYDGKLKLLFTALFMKFITHFTTAAVYFFTALAIGVTTAEFWPVTFGSTIQILATLLSPTIAGEGAREAFQALLLSNQLGGVAQAVLSGALGFIAAEAATLWGGLFLFVRTPEWRPAFAEVDGVQVDYAWLADDDGSGFDEDAVAAIHQAAKD